MVLTDRLLEIVVQDRAVGRLQDFLRGLRRNKGLDASDFPVTGTTEATVAAVTRAIDAGQLHVAELASFVDEIEETGGQHIFPFDLSTEGRQVSSEDLDALFPRYSGELSFELYSEEPPNQIFWMQRDDALVVKQVYTGEYWEKSESESEETADRKVLVYNRVTRRAINTLWLQPDIGTAQLRIDRIKGRMDDKLAAAHLEEFLDYFGNRIGLGRELIPLPIWHSFPAILAAREETYMSHDEALDASVAQRITNRRAGYRGVDVRDHEDYRLDSPDYARKSLHVYWVLHDEPPRRIHTILSQLDLEGVICGKVFINAKVTPADLDHVLARIRHFTG